MQILKKENWWIWLLLTILSQGTSVLVLGALLGVYHKDAWYARWMKKCPTFIIALCFILLGCVSVFSYFSLNHLIQSPDLEVTLSFSSFGAVVSLVFMAIYMLCSLLITIFQWQILVQTNAKLKTPGQEIYLSPYVWILCLIVPIIGWICLITMFLYLEIWYLVMLYRGAGEEYIK